MSSCQYPNCSIMTDGHRYCPCHLAWIKQSGECYNCLKKKENPRHKLCSFCFQAEQARANRCHFTNCQATTTGGYPYCPCHAVWIRKNNLCYKCLHTKENAEHKLCFACHQAELRVNTQVNRLQAIKQGQCTNYWKCRNPASTQGRMCESCYKEYLQKHPHPPAGEHPPISGGGRPPVDAKVHLNIKRPDVLIDSPEESQAPSDSTEESQL